MADQGREVHIITSRQRYDDPAARLAAVDVVRQVQVHRVWTSRFGRAGLLGRTFDYLSFYLSAGWRAWCLTRRGDLLVSKTDPPLASVLGSWVARRRGARLVNWLQDLFPEVAVALNVRGMAGRVGKFLQRRRNASLHTAAINVAIGCPVIAHSSMSLNVCGKCYDGEPRTIVCSSQCISLHTSPGKAI